MAIFVLAGLPACFVFWAIALSIYLYSQKSEKAIFFSDWSWPQFLATLGFGLVIPYAILLFTAGF